MSSQFFGCDIDLTICESGTKWMYWLSHRGTMEETVEAAHTINLPYNLSSLFPSVSHPMEYWNNLDYDQFDPLEGSVEALERISKHYGIVFVSHVEGSHGRSKCNWLKKHYPFLTGISYTREKFIHNSSVVAFTDDRLNHLKGFDFHKRILFNTPYTQDVECEVYKTLNSWKDVDSNFINDLLRSK